MVTKIIVTISSGIIVSMEARLNLARNHASLENLDYEHSGHTGFASSADLANKQDKLTAGTNITIQNNVISATGSGGVTQLMLSGSAGTLTTEELTLVRGSNCIIKDQTAHIFLKCYAGSDSAWTTYANINNDSFKYITIQHSTRTWYLSTGIYTASEVLETGALVKKLYSELSGYKLIFCYGYRDALSAPNQFMFAFMPDQLQVNGEDLQFLAMAGPNNWQYPIRVKRNSDGYVYWYSGYDYGGNTTFFVTKIVGVK